MSANATSSYVVKPGTTVTPFSGITVSDPIGTTENLTVALGYGGVSNTSDEGTLSDPAGGGSYNSTTHTFTESALVTGTPTAASQILSRLVYTPPALSGGMTNTVAANVSVNGATS